jgi:hypothetical protein
MENSMISSSFDFVSNIVLDGATYTLDVSNAAGDCVTLDTITDSANRHTEWLLLQENDPNSKPNWLLEKKLIDSLLGHDSLGNAVPDPSLPNKLKYGIEIRPRQSLFVDRKEALRNIIEFSNSVLANEIVTGKVDFSNLNAVESIPSSELYDSIVEDIYNFELISTNSLVTAYIEAEVDPNGTIVNVRTTGNFNNQGFGYKTSPTITILGNGTGAELYANIDMFGRITSVDIINGGKNYDSTTELVVRPYTVVVQTDVNSGGKWAVYEWNSSESKWIKPRTQSYNTPLYWKYVDWKATDFDPFQNIVSSVAEPYALQVLQTIEEGSYVKVQNGGDGRYLILRKTNGSRGSFDPYWDIVYSENGTIYFLDSLWNSSASLFGWDQNFGWDQSQFDQSPDIEISFILNAIKNYIFINECKIYWNQLFFKAVRYAMSEQKFLDWAFKTTFISVVNQAGSLDQVSTFNLQNVSYFEDFLKEAKPYHTKIRKFTEQYTTTELTNTFNTDFDMPVYYNETTAKFEKVEFENKKLLQYPWKAWFDNFTYQIESISLATGGSGYTSTPDVTIVPAYGDTGFGATAVAFISLGKVSQILVTNPGQGYTATPTVVINGGGSTSLISARAYAQLGNCPVRSNYIRF